ncbi:hypothetical protein F5Y05DRAFT_79240 [Hypoxylon sp. FL0543]|nr:hypothetical protein F5Y05DRAFT_79240 [Hypoxylon sp. FL0543]
MDVLVDEINSRQPQGLYYNSVKTSEFAYANIKLSPSNFVFDKKRTVWVVGWVSGGFYPKGRELAAAIS